MNLSLVSIFSKDSKRRGQTLKAEEYFCTPGLYYFKENYSQELIKMHDFPPLAV